MDEREELGWGGQRRRGAEQDAGQPEKKSRGRKARGEAAVLTGTSCTAGLSSGRGPGVQSRGAGHGHLSQSQSRSRSRSQPPRAWHEPGPLLESQGQQDHGQNVAYLGTWARCQNLLPSIFLFYNTIFQGYWEDLMRTGRKCAATAGAQGPFLVVQTLVSSMDRRVQALSLPLSFLSVLLSFLVPPSMTFSGFERFWAPVP